MKSLNENDMGERRQSKQDIEDRNGSLWKVSILAVLVLVVVAYITGPGFIGAEFPWGGLSGGIPSPTGLGAVLLVIYFINPLCKRLGARAGFSRASQVMLYNMVFIGSVVLSSGFFTGWTFTVTGLGMVTTQIPEVFEPFFERISSLVFVKSIDATPPP